MLQLPPNRKKAKAYRDKSIAEVLVMRPEKALSANTINNILTNISSFLAWCVGEGLLDANPA